MEVKLLYVVIGLFAFTSAEFVPSHLLKSLSTDGLPVLKTELEGSVKQYEAYQDQVVAAQTECRGLMEPLKEECSVCMKTKCEAKIRELSCGDPDSPSWRERIRQCFVNIGNDINNFFETKFPKFTRLSNDVINFFNEVMHKIGQQFQQAYKSMKDFFANTFGRRKRSPERLEPPSKCEDFQNKEKMQTSCEYYSSECLMCRPTTDVILKNCPHVNELMELGKKYSWLHFALTYDGNEFYNVNSLYYQHESATDVVDDVQVSVVLFGEEISFPMDGRHFNPNKVKEAAPIIVQEAIKWYRKNFEVNPNELEMEETE